VIRKDLSATPPGSYIPTAKDFTAGAIRAAVMKRVSNNSLFLFPLVFFLSGFAAWGMFDSPWVLGAGILSGFVSFSTWIYNFGVRGKEFAREHVQKLLSQRRAGMQYRLESVTDDCRQAGFDAGESAAFELDQEYRRLREFLGQKLMQNPDDQSVARYIALTDQTYNEGIGILRRALDDFTTLEQIDSEKLRSELIAFQKELAKLEGKKVALLDEEQSRVRALNTYIEGHKRRLSIYTSKVEEKEQLLAQGECLEGALEVTYFNRDSLVGDSILPENHAASNALQSAVDAAMAVERKLRGEDTREQDKLYEQAAKEARKDS